MSDEVVLIRLTSPQEVVEARRRTHAIAQGAGIEAQDCNRLATAVSELARVAFARAGSGEVVCSFARDRRGRRELVVRVSPLHRDLTSADRPRRLRDAAGALDLSAVARLVDRVTWVGDAALEVARFAAPGAVDVAELEEAVAATEDPRQGAFPLEEIERQNRQLMAALAELQRRQEELLTLNAMLEDTNRGVTALHAELAGQAAELRRSDAGRRRLLHVVAHETRTPLYAIRGLVEVLRHERSDVDDADLALIDDAAREALGVVNEALEVSRAVAGKMVLELDEVPIEPLFSSLRGMLRPLRRSEAVELRFGDPAAVGVIRTDPGKLATILRNLVANALKFTDAGEVRVEAVPSGEDRVRFVITDTGIGIDPADHERVFGDFEQVASAQAGALGGTGLGLPLVRRLTELLGGRVTLDSMPGHGSRFTVELPRTPPVRADGR